MVDNTNMDTPSSEVSAPESTLAAPTGMAETGVDVFNAIMEKHDPAAGLKAMADGEGNEKIQEAQAESDTAATESFAAADEPAQAQPAVEDKDREKALVALRRAKTPSDTIDALDDQALTKWGLELAKDQAEVDRRLSQPRERATEGSNEGVEESVSAEQPTQPPAPIEPALDLKEMLGPLEEYLDSDGTKVLASVLEKANANMNSQMTGMESQLSQQQNMIAQLTANQMLSEQVAKWPQLADAEVRESARGKMSMLASTGEYTDDNIGGLVDDAMRLIGHHQADEATSGRTLELDRKRDGGNATVTKAQTRSKPITDDQRHRSAFSEIMDRHS